MVRIASRTPSLAAQSSYIILCKTERHFGCTQIMFGVSKKWLPEALTNGIR